MDEIKKAITMTLLMVLIVLFVGYIAAGAQAVTFETEIAEQKEIQNKAHQAANLLRELGYAEDSAEIKGLQDKWWEAHYAIEGYGKYKYAGRYQITGYDACEVCCGKTDAITASGVKATAGRTVAMRDLPFGTKIYIDGLGEYVVEDRGVRSGVVDVFCNSHKECYEITGKYDVYAME